MTKRRFIRLLCTAVAAVLAAGLFAACGKSGTKEQAAPPGTYWKAVLIEGGGADMDEFWADLFLWEDGTGYFRFSQATAESNYYGFRDVFACVWDAQGEALVLAESEAPSTALYTGTHKQNRLVIPYDGFFGEALTITMERADMPPYGAQWEIPDLYGTWRMVSYADTNGEFSVTGPDVLVRSEITIHSTLHAELFIEGTQGDEQTESELQVTHKEGAGWAGCKNRAWHAELAGSAEPDATYDAALVDGKLLLKKAGPKPGFPGSFTAIYERKEDAADTVSEEAPYTSILGHYADFAGGITDADELTERLTGELQLNMRDDNGQRAYELGCSAAEAAFERNMGYALRDINGDGSPELFILADEDYALPGFVYAIYTLHGGEPVLAGAYWSRHHCAVGKDGLVYVISSGGADDTLAASYVLDPQSGEFEAAKTMDAADFPAHSAKDAGLVFNSFMNKPLKSASDTGAVYPFSGIVGYKGTVYSIYASPEIPNFIGISGSDKFTPLPEAIGKRLEGESLYVYSFTIYDGKIYYLAAEPGSDITPGAVYRCALDGSQNERIADANNFSTCMLSNGWLYFDAETDSGGHDIYKVDPNDTTSVQRSDFPEIAEPGIFVYEGFCYYFSEGTLYRKNIRTGAVSVILALTTGPMNTYGDGHVMAVANDTIYYVTAGEYGESGNTFLLGTSIHGGTGKVLASWFTS